MPDLEGIGEAVSGAATARAVEPVAGEPDGRTDEKNCLNCGQPLVGDFCHGCGQKAHVHRTLGAFGHDILHSVLHFEGKIWRTLPLLAWYPGDLTRRYIDGERAKFVSPMALFLFSVFLMFAVFSAIGGPVVTGTSEPDNPAAARAEARADFERERREAMGEIRALEAERARLVAAGRATTDVDVDLRVARSQLALEERLFNQALDLIVADERRGAQQAERERQSPAKARSEGEVVLIGGAESLNQWFTAAYRKAKRNPDLLIYKLQTSAYKFSWLLIPISVPFVWLLFLHRRRYRQFHAYDHTVFVTYSIAFMSLGVIALSLLRPLGLPASASVLAMLIVPPLHMYRQLKGAYRLSRASALWRTAALLWLAMVTIIIFATVLLLMGVLG